jgi:hypothetical protein
MSTKHLWEIHHPYYASESNYYSNDAGNSYDSWYDFIESEGGNDKDLNAIFRWDWNRPDPDDYEPGSELPSDTLQLIYISQRKGIYRPVRIAVTEADEPAVIEFLRGYAQHVVSLWEPFLDAAAVGAE